LDIGERLAEAIGDAFGKKAVGGATDKFHGSGEMGAVGWAAIVDSDRAIGNTLLANPSVHFFNLFFSCH
jgi:hypothetical protein